MYNLYNSDTIILDFLNYLKSCGLSKNSVRFYKSDLKLFNRWFSGQYPRQTLKPTHLEEYKKFLLMRQVSVKTINRRLSTLRKFFAFLKIPVASPNLPATDP
ncbi:hypothetical protein COX04_00870, partial [Candidatus Woesebacteria bacterium CG22_combo_CG10-13_8_21_14_all_45_10]